MHSGESSRDIFCNWCGIDVHVEFCAGDVRHGKTLQYAYGEIPGTKATDGDPLDVILGPSNDAPMVYVVHQQFPDNGTYDEDKLYLGFDSAVAAKIAYLTQYSPSHFGAISAITVDALRKKIRSTDEVIPKIGEPLFVKAFGSQTLAQNVVGNAVLKAKLTLGHTLLAKSEGFSSIPASLTQTILFATETATCERFRHCADANSEVFSDLAKALSLTTQVDRLLDRPRQASVLSRMLGCVEHLQIVDGVVQAVPVLVVDDLIRSQLPSQKLFHDIPMLRDLASANGDVPVRCLSSVTPKPTLAKTLRRVGVVEERLHKSLNAEAIKNAPDGNRRVQTGGAVNFVYNSGPGPRAKPEVSPDTVEYLKQASGIIERERARRTLSVEHMENIAPKTPVKVFALNSDGTNTNNPYDINVTDDRATSAEIGQQVLEIERKRYSNALSSPFRNNESDEVSSVPETSPDELKVKRTG